MTLTKESTQYLHELFNYLEALAKVNEAHHSVNLEINATTKRINHLLDIEVVRPPKKEATNR